MELYKSPVQFNSEEHTYTLGEKQLSGITSIISKYITPAKYDAVSTEIMQRAIQRGQAVHSQLEELFIFGNVMFGEPREEVKAYQALAKEKGLKQAAAEYLVDSENDGIATKIDSVLRVEENVVDLVDYKTTCNVDKTSLSWQLSLSKYMFERCNPTIYVRNLYGIHLKGDKARLIDIKPVPMFAIKQLLLAHQLGLDELENPMNTNQ